MLPRLAAAVCRTAIGTTSFSWPAIFNTAIPKGTKVISETSLVITMLHTKGRKTSTDSMLLVDAVTSSRRLPRDRNIPAF